MKRRKLIQNLVWILWLISLLTSTSWIICLSCAIGVIVHIILMLRAEKGHRLPYGVVTAFFLLSMAPAIAFAAKGNLAGPTDRFTDVCDSLFAEGSGYQAIGRSGDDVTGQFVQEYREAYLSGNYAAIWEAAGDDLSCITWEQDVPRENEAVKKSSGYYVHDKTVEHVPGKDFEMIYYVSGSFAENDGTGQITECDNGVVEVDYFNAGPRFSYTQQDSSTNGTISNDQKNVTFSGKFSLSLHKQIIGFDVWTENFGPYTGSVTGYSQC